jgi:heme oxygenase
MKSDLRKKLYESTKNNHLAVENSFNFSEGISISKLETFHQSILRSRLKYQKSLHHLEETFNIKSTYNDDLISSLKSDLKSNNDIIDQLEVKNTSHAIGVFYVFAGSAMGARVIRKMALEHDPPIQSHYITKLIETANSQMKILGLLLDDNEINEIDLINGANETFSTLTKYANIEYKKKHKSI